MVLEENFTVLDSGQNSYICKTSKGAKLDFNAIAQGYSVDIISDLLESKNIQNYMVEIGGEIRVRGLNHKGELWKIGIERPVDSSFIGEHGFQRIINLDNQALATSGNYRKFKTINGNRVSHTLNPLTGYPANNNLLSVSVITDKSSTADALATSFMVMGKSKSIAYINELEKAQFQVYMIYDSLGEYKEWSNFKLFLQLVSCIFRLVVLHKNYKLHPLCLNKGYLLAHVLENSPSFFTINFMAIPAKHKATKPIESKINFIPQN